MAVTAEVSVGKRERPVGICPRCHAIVRAFDQIDRKCGRATPFGTKCPGVIRSALSADDWVECPDCGATGRIGENVCARCGGEGWLHDSKRLRFGG